MFGQEKLYESYLFDYRDYRITPQVISHCRLRGYTDQGNSNPNGYQQSISNSTVAQVWVKGSSTQLFRPLSKTLDTLKRSGTTSSSLRDQGLMGG